MRNVYPPEVVDGLNENIDVVEFIGKLLPLYQSGKTYKTLCPFHKEKNPSLVIFPDTNSWYCFGCGAGTTIVDFVKLYYNMSFKQAINYLIAVTGFDPKTLTLQPTCISTLRKLYHYKNRGNMGMPENTPISEDFLNQFPPYIVQEWVEEGISEETQRKYDIRICKKRSRWLIPVRDENNVLVAILGRTYLPDWKELGLNKYVYIKPEEMQNVSFVNNVLFGLNYNYQYIKEQNEVIVFEAHKSVMKADSMGIYNTVAIGTNCINRYLVDKLLKLKCNIVLALDKDVPLDRVKKEGDKFRKFTNVYIIYDFDNLLDEKDAPVDKGKEVFMRLYEKKIRL